MRLNRNISRSCQHLTPASETYAKLNVPFRVKRGPTDILKALSGTVGCDPTAPAYKHHDDPYLHPISGMEKKTYALSKESGRKAARWIRDAHPELFQHQPDDPVIKGFLPRPLLTLESEVSEADLLVTIHSLQVARAIQIYEMCQDKDVELCMETRQALLELVCFYNGEDPVEAEWVEEGRALFALDKRHGAGGARSWKDDGLAEKLFQGLKEEEGGGGAAPYCALIRGMCAHGQTDRAWHLYQEALSQKLPLDTGTWNALLRVSPRLREDNMLRWDLAMELLRSMASLGVPPNLGTLNAVLECLSIIRSWAKCPTLALQTLTEFRQMGIQPSLATYYHLLRIFYTMRNQRSGLLCSILDQIEGETFSMRDLNDTMFFFSAMEICMRDLESFETAARVHRLLETGDNMRFLGENIKENIYYRNYVMTAVNALPLAEFMDTIYSDLVPHKYSPDKEVMEEIIRMMGVADDVSLLPRLWSDCISGEVARNARLMETALMVLSRHDLEGLAGEDSERGGDPDLEGLAGGESERRGDPELEGGRPGGDHDLRARLANVAWDVWTRVQGQNDRLKYKVEWSGQMLGDCVSSLCRLGEAEKAATILGAADADPFVAGGVMPPGALQTVLDAFVGEGRMQGAMMVVKYASFHELSEAPAMAGRLLQESSRLPEGARGRLTSIAAAGGGGDGGA